jgi:hypothetical protein
MDLQGLDYWDFFAEEARRAEAPLYEKLARGIGADGELRGFANGVKPGQPPANVLFAAVHFLLLRGARHPLRGFYRNLGGDADGDPFPAFCDFVAEHRDVLAPLIAAGITNTNEVGRSAFLLPAFLTLARGEPLHLIEIGPSAGLNMIWDRYGAAYRRDGESFRSGAPGAELVLDCEARGEKLPPLGPPPKVARRVGLERNPVDLADADARDWLKALVWPDHVSRFARLEQAMAIHARHRPEIRTGNALDLLSDVLAEAPEGHTLCVYHTMAVYQFSDEMRQTLDAILTMAGLRRDVWRLSLEGSLQGENALELTRYRDGAKHGRKLARCHPHGGWIEWLAD